MCHDADASHVRLYRCQHGTFHLTLGRQTLHLSTEEVLTIGQAVNRWVQRHPGVLHELSDEQWQHLDARRIG